MKPATVVGNVGTLCIMGLSSAGKSTLATLLVDRLREHDVACALIDGDEVRHLFEERYGYDPESRRKQSRRLLKLARWVEKQHIIPVVAMIHPFEDDRVMFRETLNNYYQIHLECDLDECILRDKRLGKGVYSLKEKAGTPNVVGLDIPFERVDSADLVVDSKNKKAEELLEILWEELQKSFFPKAGNAATISRKLEVFKSALRAGG